MDIVTIMSLAAAVEGFINYLAGDGNGIPRRYLKYVSLGLGVVVAFMYQVDIPSMAGLVTDYPLFNYVVSGIIIGRGSNYVNDILGSLRR